LLLVANRTMHRPRVPLESAVLLAGLSLALAHGRVPPCQVSVVGAGWGGVYTAWRLAVDTQRVPADRVCVFEAFRRNGGRTYSIRFQDYMIDAGAYRFAGDMHLPADLIAGGLGLPSVWYDPEGTDDDVRGEVQWPYQEPLRKVVDAAGRHAGYGAAIDLMLTHLAAAGARITFGTKLTSLTPGRGGQWLLGFSTGASVQSQSVLLNLPRPALRHVGGLEEAMGARWQALTCSEREFPPKVTEGPTTVKVYAVYEDAWWVSMLGLLRGTKEDMLSPPASIHYHDGEVVCQGGVDPSGAPIWRPARELPGARRCRGVLQVFYRHSQMCPAAAPHCMDFWAALPRPNASEPLALFEGAVGAELRSEVHRKLLAMHMSEFRKHNITEDALAKLAPPVALAVSVWAHEGTLPPGDDGLLTGPQDVICKTSRLPAACGTASPTEYQEMVQGTGRWVRTAPGLHVANNDFFVTLARKWHGPWAEQSLLVAEAILASAFGLGRPAWLNATYYAAQVPLPHMSSGAGAPGIATREDLVV